MRLKLIHHPICPHSRFVRLALHEYNLSADLIGEKIWERREEFLMLNAAGTLPVLLVEGQSPVPGAATIAEYLIDVLQDRANGLALIPRETITRIEVRRLMYWFNEKFFKEVSGPLTDERYRLFMPPDCGGGSRNHSLIREARENIGSHLAYIDLLVAQHDWLAGNCLTYADLAAAAHLSIVDHLDDVEWPQGGAAKRWFERMQSRPSFRSLKQSWKGFVRRQ